MRALCEDSVANKAYARDLLLPMVACRAHVMGGVGAVWWPSIMESDP